jgi:hypothetical protein
MTGADFAFYIRFKTRTNPQTFTDTEIVAVSNVWLEDLAKQVMGSDEDTLVMPMHTDLIANLREYPLPLSLLSRIKFVEAKLDGTNFIHLDEFDLNQYRRPTDEADIVARFSNEEGRAFYDLNRKSLVLYSGAITAVTAGLKLWCNTYPAPLNAAKLTDGLTDLSVDPTTTSHGFPREFHKLWATGVIIDYKESREKPIPLTESELTYQKDLQSAIIALKHGNLDRAVFAQLPPASERGNNGYDY